MAKKGGNNILAIGVGLNTEPLEAGFNDAAKSAKEGMSKVAQEVIQSGAKVQQSTEQTKDKLVSLRTQFRQATQDAQQMAEKHGMMSQQFIASAARAGELKDQIGDINTVITAFSADSKFTVVAGALQQAAGAASIVTGAMGLLGTESKETQEMLLKVQSALALTQGLASIKEMGAAFTALQAVIVGQVIPSITAMGTATIVATGGVIVVLAAATAAVISYNNSIDAETEAFKRANEEAKKNAEINKKIGDIVAQTTSLRIAAMKDGFAKEKELLQSKTNEQLRAQFDAFNKGEIAEFTYNQRIKYIREAAYNELAKLEEKYKPKPIKPSEAIVRKQAGQTPQLQGLSMPELVAPEKPLQQYETSFSIAAQKAALIAKQRLEQLNNSIQGTINNTLVSTFSGLGQMLGEALVNGVNDPFAALSAMLLQSFGSLMVQMGNAYIAYGIADSAFKASIFSGNPFGAIAAGVALVAAGSAISAVANNMTQKPNSSSPVASSATTARNNSNSFMGGNGTGQIEIIGMIRGTDIELTNRRNVNKVERSVYFG